MEVDSGSACIVWHKKANNVCVLMGIETQYLSDYVEYVDLMNMIMSDVYGNPPPPEILSKKIAEFDKKYKVDLRRPGTVVEISDPFHQGKKEPPKSVKYVSLAVLESYECSSESDLPACKHYFGERAKLLGSIIGARVQYDSPVFDRTCYKVNFRIISEDQTLTHLKRVSEQTFGFLLKSSIKSSYRSTFGILKGRSYAGETDEQTMRREIKEESGTKLGSSVKLTKLHAKDDKNQFFALKIEEKDVGQWNDNLKSRETRHSGELFDVTFVEFFDENMQEIHSPFDSKFKMNRVSSKILSVFVDACKKGEIDGCMSAARAARADSSRDSPRARDSSRGSPRVRAADSADSYRGSPRARAYSHHHPRDSHRSVRADSRADSYRSSYRTQRRDSSPRRDRVVSTIRKDGRPGSDRGNSRPGPGSDRGTSRSYRGRGGRTRTRKRKY